MDVQRRLVAGRAMHPYERIVATLVGEGAAGAHDLVRMMRNGRIYWAAPESQFYAEPKKLAQAGYLTPRPPSRAGHTPARTTRSPTPAGHALKAWLATPTPLPAHPERARRPAAGE